LVIYSTGAAGGNVSFIPEHGSHAGPSAEEMNTFIVRPRKIVLAQTITHPAQLYDHFLRYQSGFANAARYSSEQAQHHSSNHRAPRTKKKHKGLQPALRLGSDCTRPGKLTLAGDNELW
jgi:hypothetical protein